MISNVKSKMSSNQTIQQVFSFPDQDIDRSNRLRAIVILIGMSANDSSTPLIYFNGSGSFY